MVKKYITEVIPGSAASKAGIQPNQYLISINDEPVLDIIDYQFFSALENMTIVTESVSGERFSFKIHKESWDNLGLIFREDLLGHVMNCANNCVFCFIAQMPPNMRNTLYVKDDDWRMSLIMGNYITMTNLSDKEFERIIRRHVSPLYISVHATDPEIRAKMLKNNTAKNIMIRLQRLYDEKIHFHCQIVLCPEWNDGHILEKTIKDLFSLRPYASSVAVVPVGLTKYRDKLPFIKSVTKEKAREVISFTDSFGKKAYAQTGTHFVFASDEMYMLAEYEFPEYEYYEDFPQIENGVGLCAKLIDEYQYAQSFYHATMPKKRILTIATGTSAAPLLKKLIHEEQVHVVPIRNDFFGETITVAGLVTGKDLIQQLKNVDLGNELIIPCSMLREGNDVFLDDVLFEEVEKTLKIKTTAIPVDGVELYKTIYCINEDMNNG